MSIAERSWVGISFLNAAVAEMEKAWDKALALSDHGVQMAKKSTKQFFKDPGITRLFTRYQKPKDNTGIESRFRTLKHDWLMYKDYATFGQLKQFIASFIGCYNNERYHGSPGYVTPSQMHTGEATIILEERIKRKSEARRKRLEHNRTAPGESQQKVAWKCCFDP